MGYAGRKRKSGVIRNTRGKSRGEPLGVSAEVRAVRERILKAEGVKPAEALNSLAGFTLGKLLLRGRADRSDPISISQEQYEAGEEFARIVHRHSIIMGYRLNIVTPSFIMVGGSSGSGAESDQEAINRARQRFTSCYNALMAQCKTHGMRVRDVTYGCAVENWPVATLSEDDYGHLRTGLNALAKVL